MEKEFNQIYYLNKILHHHRLFYGVFELGNPQHTTKIPTAAVGYNENTGKVDFLINPDFFYSLGENEQLFVLCHEALHILLSHIERTKEFELDPKLANIAQDIVINELLINEFGFDRQSLNFNFEPCFIDTVFTKKEIKEESIKKGRSFEYYYKLLEKLKKEDTPCKTIDSHDLEGLGDESLEMPGESIIKIPEQISDNIIENAIQKVEAEELIDIQQSLQNTAEGIAAGKGAFGNLFSIQLTTKREDNNWEKIVKNKIASFLKKDKRVLESFIKKPRRLVNLDDDIYLPEYVEEEKTKNDKFNLYFFLDSSGSCIGYKDDFFNLVKTIPTDKFNIRLYSFDTDVYLLNIKVPKVKGGGGTAFDIIEREIQKEKNIIKKYPDLVFILTDGYGNSVSPEKPGNWYWIMTEGHCKSYVDPASHIIKLNKMKIGLKI